MSRLSDLSSFGNASLHQRLDPRNTLFENYHPEPRTADYKARRSPIPSSFSVRDGKGMEKGMTNGMTNGMNAGSSRGEYGYRGDLVPETHAFRAATPNKRGQYSDAILSSLEAQNDSEVEGIMGKVRQLKSLTIAIGDEIRDSSILAEKMNESFHGTRARLRGTMSRMLVMAQKTGVGWKAWVAFFCAVVLLFWWVRFVG